MQISDRTDEQIQADIKQLKNALAVPNLPGDEREMHSSLLLKLQTEMGRRMNATQPVSRLDPKQNQPFKNEPANQSAPSRSPLGVWGSGGGSTARLADVPSYSIRGDFKADAPTANPVNIPSRTITAGGHSKTADPITSKIELANNSEKFNPSITITWSDGYKLTVDETAATGRFKSTFRDTLALKCVGEQRFTKMWRWDTPWRAAGFYKAITAMRDGVAPTLKDLGYTHPSDRQREVFAMITQAFSNHYSDI